MRRKIAEPIEAGADLPDITDQQRRFVEGILSGKTSSDAYRAAYDCSNSLCSTVWAEASRLRSDYKVAAWLAAARKAGLGHTVVTLAGHIAELERLREIALDTGNVGAAVQAEQLRGKAQGHYVERLEVSAADPLETLRQIAAVSPHLAAQLAAAQGIEWQEPAATEH